MYRVIKTKSDDVIELKDIQYTVLDSSIIVSEKGNVQDILTTTMIGTVGNSRVRYSWRSLYLRPRFRNSYDSIKEAIESRLDKGASVYVFANRKEFAEFLKHNNERTG